MKDDSTGRKTLITGITGFIGSNLARRLVDEKWTVHAIVRPGSDLSIVQDLRGQVIYHQHDGSTQSLVNIVARANPIVVFHLASLFLAQHTSEDIEALITSNILFSTQLTEALVANKVANFINTGTSWQHYNNSAYDPVCLYAATKEAYQDVLQFYVQTTNLKVITLKLFDTYGPNDPRPKLFSALQKAANESKPLPMSHGEQLIDLVYIDDVVNAYFVAAQLLLDDGDIKQEEYAVSSGKPISLRELVALFGNVTGTPVMVDWGGRPYRLREVMVPWDKGKTLPGWKPSIGIEEGIKRLSVHT